MTKRFGELTAVDHVDLTVRAGEIYGFLGPNGSGKTTFLRMLCGLLRADDGNRFVLDQDVGVIVVGGCDDVGIFDECFHKFSKRPTSING